VIFIELLSIQLISPQFGAVISKDKKRSSLVPLKIQGIAQFHEQGAVKLLTVFGLGVTN
jgi:hypothetical protein